MLNLNWYSVNNITEILKTLNIPPSVSLTNWLALYLLNRIKNSVCPVWAGQSTFDNLIKTIIRPKTDISRVDVLVLRNLFFFLLRRFGSVDIKWTIWLAALTTLVVVVFFCCAGNLRVLSTKLSFLGHRVIEYKTAGAFDCNQSCTQAPTVRRRPTTICAK